MLPFFWTSKVRGARYYITIPPAPPPPPPPLQTPQNSTKTYLILNPLTSKALSKVVPPTYLGAVPSSYSPLHVSVWTRSKWDWNKTKRWQDGSKTKKEQHQMKQMEIIDERKHKNENTSSPWFSDWGRLPRYLAITVIQGKEWMIPDHPGSHR